MEEGNALEGTGTGRYIALESYFPNSIHYTNTQGAPSICSSLLITAQFLLGNHIISLPRVSIFLGL